MKTTDAATGTFILVLCALTISPTASQEKILAPTRFSEAVREQAPVAGEVFRGIFEVPRSSFLNLRELNVLLPPGPASRLCLAIQSKDARYYGEVEYELPPRAEQEKVYLQVPTRHSDVLSRYRTSSVSVLASIAAACRGGKSDANAYLAVQLERPSAEPLRFMMWLNVGAPSIDARIFDRRAGKFYVCVRGETKEKEVAFDRECHFSIMGSSGFRELVIVRNRFNERLEDIVLQVYLP
jgi:hypothetical protein